ncbi:phage holin family protein [Devosia sp.]|uniref:phage holin family protein n=1 Tax=Devosia sp. TaxID=1871048 RepID=UPI002EFCB9A5
MSTMGEQRSLPDLLRDLSADVTMLFRKEVQLAKTEAGEKARQMLSGAGLVLAGGVLALGALGVLLAAAVSILGALFVNMGMAELTAFWLAALIVGGVVGILAWVLIARGLRQMQAQELALERTARSLARDADVIKERVNV